MLISFFDFGFVLGLCLLEEVQVFLLQGLNVLRYYLIFGYKCIHA